MSDASPAAGNGDAHAGEPGDHEIADGQGHRAPHGRE
jgi:hypothetical protein